MAACFSSSATYFLRAMPGSSTQASVEGLSGFSATGSVTSTPAREWARRVTTRSTTGSCSFSESSKAEVIMS